MQPQQYGSFQHLTCAGALTRRNPHHLMTVSLSFSVTHWTHTQPATHPQHTHTHPHAHTHTHTHTHTNTHTHTHTHTRSINLKCDPAETKEECFSNSHNAIHVSFPPTLNS